MNSNTPRGVRAAASPSTGAVDDLPTKRPTPASPATAPIVPLRPPAARQSPETGGDDPGDDPGPQAA